MSATFSPWRLEQARHGEDGADAHLVRLAARDREAAEDAERLDAALGRLGAVHHHAGRRAVGELRRVAGSVTYLPCCTFMPPASTGLSDCRPSSVVSGRLHSS